MDLKIMRLSGSTCVGTRLCPTIRRVQMIKKLCANQVLYRCQAGSKKNFKGFYLGFMRDLKWFRAYGPKRVLYRSYPALRMSIKGFCTEQQIMSSVT